MKSRPYHSFLERLCKMLEETFKGHGGQGLTKTSSQNRFKSLLRQKQFADFEKSMNGIYALTSLLIRPSKNTRRNLWGPLKALQKPLPTFVLSTFYSWQKCLLLPNKITERNLGPKIASYKTFKYTKKPLSAVKGLTQTSPKNILTSFLRLKKCLLM